MTDAPIASATIPEPLIIRAIDVETCGMEPSDPIVEVGWCDITIPPDRDAIILPGPMTTIGPPKSELVDPGRPIPPQAMGVHHITNKMVEKARNVGWVLREMLEDVDAFAAHNVDMERGYIAVSGIPWLCTYKSSLRVYPEAPDHKLQTLRYWLDIDLDPELASPPHRAGPDAYICAHVIPHLLKKQSFNTLTRWSEGPALLVKCFFKKHRNELWSEIAKTDPSYLNWVAYKSEMDDRDAVATAKYWLKKHYATKNAKGGAKTKESEDDNVQTMQPDKTLV